MCDSSIEEDLERYRRNNVELAVALNDLKAELNIVQTQLLDRNREFQQVYDENATLKQNLVQKDAQLCTWKALIVDLVTTNTRKYTDVMQKVGLVPAANGMTKPKENFAAKPENSVSTTFKSESNDRANVLRRRRQSYDDSPRLPDLTEESINSQFNESISFTKTPEKRVSHVTSRRRASTLHSTPPSPLREVRERLVGNGETRGKRLSERVQKMDRIIDENTPINGTTSRPSRKTAPKNLSEPKLGTKLRRT